MTGDLNGDGIDDLFLAQNYAAFPTNNDRLDAGRGLWLRGLGQGNFSPMKGQNLGLRFTEISAFAPSRITMQTVVWTWW